MVRDEDISSAYRVLIRALWAHGREAGRPWSCARIAEVAFFEDGFVAEWFFSDKGHALRRKHRANTSNAIVAAELLKRRVRTGDAECDVLALAYVQAPHAGPRVLPLSREGVRWLLMGDAANRLHLTALQWFAPPRGGRECILRADWRAQLVDLEMRFSRVPLAQTSVPPEQRLATFSPVFSLSQPQNHIPLFASQTVPAVCASISDALQTHLPRIVRRVAADLKLVGGSSSTHVLLVWAALPPPHGPFPEHLFPASAPVVPEAWPEMISRAGGASPLSGRSIDSAVAFLSRQPSLPLESAPKASPTSTPEGARRTSEPASPPPSSGASPQSGPHEPSQMPSAADSRASSASQLSEPSLQTPRQTPQQTTATAGPRRPSSASSLRAASHPAASQLLCSKLFACPGCGKLESRAFGHLVRTTSEPWQPPPLTSFNTRQPPRLTSAALPRTSTRTSTPKVGVATRPLRTHGRPFSASAAGSTGLAYRAVQPPHALPHRARVLCGECDGRGEVSLLST